MATLNDFKLINNTAKRYFNYLRTQKKVNDNQKKRLGFYLFVLENVSKITDIEELTNCIIDTEFCSIVFDEKNDDLGIDAVIIDNDVKEINLFNFKYRENYKEDTGLKANDAINSVKFLNCVSTENTSKLDKRTKLFVEEIIKCLNSEEIWKMSLYMVSNENKKLVEDGNALAQYKDHYSLEIKSITLNDIVNYMSKRPEKINAKIFLDSASVMTYEENELSSSKSYLIKLSLLDLIRITCNKEEIRGDYALNEETSLREVDLDYGLLFDNVRGYLGETKFNKSIFDTLEKEPSKFFMYNNGLTMISKDITTKLQNGNKKILVTIDGFQIVNGGQTLRTIYNYKKNNYDEETLSTGAVLVRIFQTEDDQLLISKIAEYTNSQNAISSINLKSINIIQIQIESFLKEKGILYVRKSGDIGEENTEYTSRISMEKMAQIIYSIKGYPDRATNQKKRLFEDYYEEIFNGDLEFEKLADYVNTYDEIQEKYLELNIKNTLQKSLYVMYLEEKKKNIEFNIKMVENAIQEYKKDEDLSPARKIIQKGFKDKLDEIYSNS